MQKIRYFCWFGLFFVIVACSEKQQSVTPQTIITRMVEVPVKVEVTRLEPIIKENEIPVTVEVTRETIQTVEVPVVIGNSSLGENPDTPQPTTLTLPSNIVGTYSLSLSDEGGCILLIAQGENAGPFNELRFELHCNRGAPSYNSGTAEGVMRTAGNQGVYTIRDYSDPKGFDLW